MCMRIVLKLVIIFLLYPINMNATDLTKYIDPLIGTDGIGHTFPGATTPFGMVQLSPSSDNPAWNWCSGYHYTDNTIKGFAHNHISGAGLGAFGDILIMPTMGELKLSPGTEQNPDSGYRSRFSHTNEIAKAGYYAVYLSDNNVNVELTTTPRVGFHRYTFSENGKSHIILDPTHSVREDVESTEIKIISNQEIMGKKVVSGGAAGRRNCFFYIQFSRPFKISGIAKGDSIYNLKELGGKGIKSFVSYDVISGESIELKVSISYVDYQGAIDNYKKEGSNITFDDAYAQNKEMWQNIMNKIKIEADEKQKRIFYTALYHSYISPNIISDVNGNYIINNKKYHSKLTQYSNYSTWDTFRCTHPLYTILSPTINKDFVNCISSRFVETGELLPIWECGGFDNLCMIGRSPVAIIGEAILKGIPDINIPVAYDIMKRSLMATDKSSPNYGKNNGMREYISYGFVPAEIDCSVSKTLEYNYYDYVMSKVAHMLGNVDDEFYFKKRSQGYKHLWNDEKKFFWPKKSDGSWVDLEITRWDSLVKHYISGNIWGYSTFIPHDINFLIEKLGGKHGFFVWLNDIFLDTTEISGNQHVDISGFIGKYGHGDEPSHQMPYLFSYVGFNEQTQIYVDKIRNEMYNDTPDGLINNDDLGQMSSWYIFSALGFYPVCPVDGDYVLGTPLFDKAVITLENGKELIIIKEGENDTSFVDSVMYNGENIKTKITHRQLMNGGILRFIMRK